MDVWRLGSITIILLLVSHGPAGEYFHQRAPHRVTIRRHGTNESPESSYLPDAPAVPALLPKRTGEHECPTNCVLRVANLGEMRSTFRDFFEDAETRLVHFKIRLEDYSIPVLETYPYMDNSYLATEWVWASGRYGRKLLGLPLDAEVLSLYILEQQRRRIELSVSSAPANCLVMHSPECRLHAIRSILIYNVTYVELQHHQRDYICHYVINNTTPARDSSRLLYRCCETDGFRAGDVSCQMYAASNDDLSIVLLTINVLSTIVTLFSPLIILKTKMALMFTSVTKFFRASLKHGITGQRNYVIRISSRQLINLGDRQPFSIPRSLFRLICYCYGEGRCCIHWWGEWGYQPRLCKKKSCCRQCWLVAWKIVGIVVLYPVILHVAILLYMPRLPFYYSLISHVHGSEKYGPISLNINFIGNSLIPLQDLRITVWMLFSVLAFLYTILVVSWPNSPLERCLLRYEGKRPFEQTASLHGHMTKSYKQILYRLAYGDYKTKRHFFLIKWIPWGLRRLLFAAGRVLMQIPAVNVCFLTYMIDAKFFEEDEERRGSADEDRDELSMEQAVVFRFSARAICKGVIVTALWFGFVIILFGFCTTMFLMVEFLLNVVFFVLVGAALFTSAVLPWIVFVAIMAYYIDDTLSAINAEHRQILKLIDENSPRISAIEETEEFFHEGAIQILKRHNLGAVKFIDGDNTEYVSKELYYNVCNDLKRGWSSTMRRILFRLTVIFLYLLFLFSASSVLLSFVGSRLMVFVVVLVGSTVPKLTELYVASRKRQPDLLSVWAKIIPEILDRHIRVDRTECVDDKEEELTTYDVRPVGVLEMELPRLVIQRTLHLWKFPWVVSGDQQVQSGEAVVVAVANKLAAASFLTKVVMREYSPNLYDEPVLRLWSLLIENSILEASATAGALNGTTMDTVSLFPAEFQPLVAQFETGNTIDQIVDCINRELYAPFTRGVLVTIGNTSCALYKVNNRLMAFNSSCHSDQVTDLFGAVLIATDFNAQNLQTTMKYLVDPYRPDAVPVYSIVPVEGFIIRSPEVLEIESVV